MSERIVVIGSNSFSGSNFVDHCLTEKCEILGISRSEEPDDVFLPYRRHENGSFVFHRLDLNNDLDRIIELIEEFKPEYVVNFAAQSMVAQSWLHPEHWFETNVVSTIKLHDRLRKCTFLNKYIHVSTPEVYGSCSGIVKERVCGSPSTPYAVSRAAADMSLMTFYNTYGFPVAFTRASNVFGPGQQLYRIVPRTILYFLTGKKLQLHGGGHSRRSFIHIKDVARGTLKVARCAENGEIFHFSTDRNITIRDLVKLIADRMGISFEGNVEIVDDRPGKDAAYLLDFSKARDTFDWNAEIELEQGIDMTIEWVKSNLDVLKNQPMEYVHKA